ncbi:hypothetical protein OG357_22915 [Streptomyces sp. NBC_01255]|uniref:hypothetical protein n=1 Tax=Streptomyces sp. NBC_01255 TaxID=2903798 RepID=UPI002E3222A4|nr:hypothetical protein [Streptomyces sp. NBC_01255]
MTAAGSSWDDFKREAFGNRTEDIEGVTVRVPSDLPFGFGDRLADLSTSSDRQDVEDLVDALFGPEVLDQWIEAGIGSMGLMTILTWGMAQGSGQTDFTFQDAYAALTSEDPGKALAPPQNRAERRARSRTTGGRSRRTTPASTGSTPAASRD